MSGEIDENINAIGSDALGDGRVIRAHGGAPAIHPARAIAPWSRPAAAPLHNR
jgi:hypothetical protein